MKLNVTFLFLMFLFLPTIGQSQDLDFTTASNTQRKLIYNTQLKKILDSKNSNEIIKYINKNPKCINDATGYKQINSTNAIELIPVIHDVLSECIAGNYDLSVLDLFIKNGTDVYINYEGVPPFYKLLDFFATTPIQNCDIAIDVFRLFVGLSNFDINRTAGTLSPPMQYLLSANYSYLGNKYDKNYIPVEVIKTFISRGINVNSYDKFGNNLLAYAVQTNNMELQNLLVNKGISIERKNRSGEDAMVLAIKSQNIAAIRQLASTGYSLSPSKMKELDIGKNINRNNKELVAALSAISYEFVNSLDEFIIFSQIFPDDKVKVLNDGRHEKLNIVYNQIPDFISAISINGPLLSAKESGVVNMYKIKYINSFHDLKSVIAALNRYPLFTLVSYRQDFYISNEFADRLADEIKSVKDILNVELKNALLAEVSAKRMRALELEKNYERFASANPLSFVNFTKLSFYIPQDADFIQLCEDFSVYLRSMKRENLTLLGVYTKDIVPEIYGYGVKNNQALFCFMWYRAGVTGDDDMYAINTGFPAFQTKITKKINSLNGKVNRIEYLGSTAYDDEKESRAKAFEKSQCDNCVINLKKSSAPSLVERSRVFGLFGTYLDNEDGVIVMKNGHQYKWNYKDDKYVIPDFFGSREFDSFEKLLLNFLGDCKIRYCK